MPEPLAEQLRRLHREATPGPWEAAACGPSGEIPEIIHNEPDGSDWLPVAYFSGDDGEGQTADVEHDRALIVTLRNALPALADLVAVIEHEYGHTTHAGRNGVCEIHPLCRALATLREQLGKP